jgi:hypothetical protein
MANYFREVGSSLFDLRERPSALWSVSSQNDLDLLPSEKEKAWDLKFRSPF